MQITTRHLLRQYKRVIEQVKKTKEPAVVVSQQQPQVAIISLDDLERLTQLHVHSDGQTLLETVRRVRALLGDEHLPADLSTQHDHYLWDDEDRNDGADRGEGADGAEDAAARDKEHQRSRTL